MRFRVSLLTLLMLLAVERLAMAHGILLESTPKSAETVGPEVSQVDLRFNSRIERAFSRVLLTGPSGERLPLPVLVYEPAGAGRLTAPLPRLSPGLYTIHWQIFTVDGHLSHGRFSFQVGER